MNAVLLTGAGFSYNWGGRLAREINTTVALRLQGNAVLEELLHRNPNFEEALTELQNEAAVGKPGASEHLQRLEAAIADAFAEMNRHLASASFNFSAERDFSLIEFLVLFDAIFTLNQDLLLEAHYHREPNSLSLTQFRKWLGPVLPGTEVIPNPAPAGLFDPLAEWRRPKSSLETTIDPQYQPYFKLHGSMNWRDSNGGRLLVMGGNKPSTMRSHPILMWYADKFMEHLSRPGARLMVIGYGFRDSHINQMIHDAWLKGRKTLSMFIVHPDGREILKKINPTYGKMYMKGPLEEITAVYDSTRSLKNTFGGSDAGELEMLRRYALGK